MKKTLFAAAIVAAGATGIAQAAPFNIVEGGDTTATAMDFGSFGSSFDFHGSNGEITAGDVDWFEFTLTADAFLQFNTISGGPGDVTMQLVNSAGLMVMGTTSGAIPQAMQQFDLLAGTYFIGVSGFDTDADASGTLLDGMDGAMTNTETFGYKLFFGASIVPVPTAAFAGLALLVPMGIKRRMNRRG